MTFGKRVQRATLGAGILLLAGGSLAHAATVTLTFSAPSGVVQNGPVTATLKDVAGGVELSLSTAFGANSANYVDKLGLDLKNATSSFVNGITITRIDAGTQKVDSLSKGLNGFSVESIKNLDLDIQFDNANKKNGALRLDHTETVSFLLQESGLTTSMIDLAVIHVQGLTGAPSATEIGTVSAVPLPAALPLFASALLGLGGLARRRRKQSA